MQAMQHQQEELERKIKMAEQRQKVEEEARLVAEEKKRREEQEKKRQDGLAAQFMVRNFFAVSTGRFLIRQIVS